MSVLSNILRPFSKELEARFEKSKVIPHDTSKGDVREDFLVDVLREYQPRKVEVLGSSIIVDTSGETSPETDVVVVEPSIPPFLQERRFAIVPVEAVYGSIEVKSNLTSDELKKSCDKFARTSQLKKTAYYNDPNYRIVNAKGGHWKTWPTAGVIVGYEGAKMDTLLQTLSSHCSDLPAFMRPHSVWVLNRGYLFWSKEDSSEIVHPMGDTVLNSNIVDGEGNVLAMMLMALSQQFARVQLPAFRITDYLDPKKDLGIKGHMSADMVFPEHAPLSFKLGIDPHELTTEQLLELENFNPRIREKRPDPSE